MLNLVPTKKIFAAGLMAAVMSTTMAAPMAYAASKDIKAEQEIGLLKRVLDNLEDAENLLNQTSRGKDGHRSKAIKAVKQAMEETKKAMRSVKKQ